MAVKLDKKIVGYKVKKDDEQPTAAPAEPTLHEDMPRPPQLHGTTYKIKPPTSEHALYVTINDIIINNKAVPYEIFLNSKNMEHFQWVSALTRVISAVFRKGGEVSFLIEELKAVFDPKGGYFHKGRFVPSLVAEIGMILERHLKIEEALTEEQIAFIADKKEQLGIEGNEYPPHATVCPKCNAKAMVRMDGCDTCLECGNSKCG